jgi:hypothetical protein
MRILYRGQVIEVGYEEIGEYYPATRENPPEYPDVEIHYITYEGVDITPILSEVDIDEINSLLVNELYG